MIRTEREYKAAVQRLTEERQRLEEHRKRLEAEGVDAAGIKRVLDPLRSFHLQLQEEVESYERLKRGDLGEIENLRGLGQILVALRIARDLTQDQLATKLGVHKSQVSRDERNEYHNITVERASRILDALGVRLRSSFDAPVLPKEPELQES